MAMPFACTGEIYQVQGSQLRIYDPITSTYLDVGAPTVPYNATGFNTLDNFAYGVRVGGPGAGNVIRINNDGTIQTVFSISVPSNSGDVDDNNGLYLRLNTSADPLRSYARVDLATGDVTNFTVTGSVIGTGDLVFIRNGGVPFLVAFTTGNAMLINLDTNVAETRTVAGLPGLANGASWTDANGRIFAFDNNTGDIYEIFDLFTATPSAAFAGQGDPSQSNDGFSCPQAAFPNLPPVAEDDNFETPFETPITRNLLIDNGNGADFDPEATALTAETTAVSGPANGTVTITAGGVMTYTPDPGFFGTDTFVYRVSDLTGLTDTATVTITVPAPPIDLLTVKTLASGDTSPEVGDTVTFEIEVTNNGPADATGVSLTDLLPAGLTATGNNGTVTAGIYNAGTGLWTIGTLSNGATESISLEGTVDVGQDGLRITNTTTAATGDQDDPTNTGNDLNEQVAVFPLSIIANDDNSDDIVSNVGSANALNVFDGDTRDNIPLDPTTATVAVAAGSSLPTGVNFDTATGIVSVDAGLIPGDLSFDYEICEIALPSNCDTATATVTIIATPIDANNDEVFGIVGLNGAIAALNAFTADTFGGVAATAANTTLAVAAGSTVPTGLSFNTATGDVDVAAGTPAGNYSFNYELCEIAEPANCDIATISVEIVAAAINAVDDDPPAVGGTAGNVNVGNVLTNDTLDGAAADPTDVTLNVVVAATAVSLGDPVPVLDPATGVISVPPNTPADTYTITYRICETINPMNCSFGDITVVVTASADLVTVKILSSGDATPEEGDTVSFEITVTNNGSAQATNVSLTDSLPSGLTATGNNGSVTAGTYDAGTGIWTLGTLDNGASATLTIEGTVDVGEGGNTITNTTTAASGDEPDPTTTGDDLQEAVTVGDGADLVTVKTLSSGDATPEEGDTVSFEITVTNNGSAQATNVSLTDSLPSGLTATGNNGSVTAGTYDAGTGIWTLGTLDNGASATLTIEGTVDVGEGGNTITNTTTAASGDEPDPTTTGDDLQEVVTIGDGADLVTVKTLSSGDATPEEGDTVSFEITVTNNGSAQATNVSLTDSLPSGLTATGNNGSVTAGTYDAGTGIWTLGTLDNGASATLTIEGTVDVGEGGNTITNTTTAASGDEPDPTTTGDDLQEAVTIGDGADLVTVKTLSSGDATPEEGDTVSFEITVTNNGSAQATNVSLTDSLPSGLTATGNNGSVTAGTYDAGTGIWTLGTLDNGASATLTIEGTVDVGEGGNTITNTTTAASGDEPDPTTTGDDLQEAVTVELNEIEALDDTFENVNGATGAITAGNPYSNDTLNGSAVDPADITGSVVTPAAPMTPGAPVPTMDTDTGVVSVPPGTPAGTYTIEYEICENTVPGNCATGTITVVVDAAPIETLADEFDLIDSTDGDPAAGNAYDNDTLNGIAVDPADITGTVITAAIPVSPGAPVPVLDTDTGNVSVASGTPAGTYTIEYEICENLNPGNCSPNTITIIVDPPLAGVSGIVFLDADGDETYDQEEEDLLRDWIVEVRDAEGNLAATVRTDDNGFYSVEDLSLGIYEISFRNPVNGVLYGTIEGLELLTGNVIIDQNLPVDPSGVFYDAITREPVAGVAVSFVAQNDSPLPADCFVDPSQQDQLTDADGFYRFDIVPGAASACPSGETEYRIVFDAPGDFGDHPSTIIAPQAGALNPPQGAGSFLVAAQDTAPVAADDTTYYLRFIIASGDRDVIHNHIPLDPFTSRASLIVSKTSTKRTASVGDLIPYTVTVRNTENIPYSGVDIVDLIPPGFRYVVDTSFVNDESDEPEINGRELRWINQTIAADSSAVYKFVMVVGAGVTDGERTNIAFVEDSVDGSEMSNRGQATVSIVASSVFDCAEIIGKVFNDDDADGYQDDGESGVAGVRLANVNGELITTDEYGRYHITCAAVPDARIGSNYVLKLDKRSLPTGYSVTSENPRAIRLTRGKIAKLNFGVKQADTVVLSLDARAFVPNSVSLKPRFRTQLGAIKDQTDHKNPLVRVDYRRARDEDAQVAKARVEAVAAAISRVFEESSDGSLPTVQTNLVLSSEVQDRE